VPLARLAPGEAAPEGAFDRACFNDACPYYVRGWTWMEQQYGVSVSYRYRIDSQNGAESPIPVWSPNALRSSLLPAEESDGADPREHS
jgi:hypothetical protein